jgi:hypothetical protein
MSKKRDAIKLARQRRQARQKVVRIITIVVVVLIVAAIAAIVIKSSLTLQAKTATAKATGTILQFTTPPPMQIDVKKQYFATVKLAKGGQFVIQLFPDKAPITVKIGRAHV